MKKNNMIIISEEIIKKEMGKLCSMAHNEGANRVLDAIESYALYSMKAGYEGVGNAVILESVKNWRRILKEEKTK